MKKIFFCSVSLLLLGATAYSQGAARPSFEVASIKPSPPLSNESDYDREFDLFVRMFGDGVKADNAQVRITFKTLEDLICRAYGVKAYQISGLQGVDDTRYDIAATMPAGAGIESVPGMLQSLLEDRFKLAVHRASKDFDVYVLSVGDSGVKILRKPVDYKFDRAATALPIKMQSLGNELTRAMGRPVLEQTGLQGEYMVPRDFQSLVTKASIGRMFPNSGAPANDMDVPSPAAIRQSLQTLGLTLNPSKQTLPIVVIDHVEKTPTEN